jgi:hypothetical protein
MSTFDTVLFIIAAVSFGLAALGIDLTNGRINTIGLGLLAWVLTVFVP